MNLELKKQQINEQANQLNNELQALNQRRLEIAATLNALQGQIALIAEMEAEQPEEPKPDEIQTSLNA